MVKKKIINFIKSKTLKLIYTSSPKTYNKIISSITYVKIGLFIGSRIQRQKQRKIIFYNNLFRNMSNTVVYDLGSSIGNMTEVFLLSGAKRVICFEPQIDSYKVAKSRFLFNDKVELNNYAISNKNQKLNLEIKSFLDLINIANKEKEVELKFDLERNVKLVSFSKGKIDISFNEKLNKNFIKTLTEKLLKWTGERWIISLSKNEGKKTFYETNIEKKNENLIKEKESRIAKKLFSAFSDAELLEVKEKQDE